MLRYASHITANQGASFEWFIEGSDDRLYPFVTAMKPTNYPNVLELAKRDEESLKMSRNRGRTHHYQPEKQSSDLKVMHLFVLRGNISRNLALVLLVWRVLGNRMYNSTPTLIFIIMGVKTSVINV